MKKENLTNQLGWAYFWLTVIVTAFGSYLKIAGDINISWWWVTAPAWGSFLGALFVIGLSYILLAFIKYLTNEK